MREFTLEMYEQLDCVHKFQDVTYKWAKFLGQKPTLGMFVPCDEAGNVLENELEEGMTFNEIEEASKKYQQALSRVIFENCSLIDERYFCFVIKTEFYTIKVFKKDTIEDLTSYNLTVKFEL